MVRQVIGSKSLLKVKPMGLFLSSGGSPSEGHNPPRGSPRKFASQRALRGLSEGSAGVSPRVLRGSAGFCGGPWDFPRFLGGSDPTLVTLGNCWNLRGKLCHDIFCPVPFLACPSDFCRDCQNLVYRGLAAIFTTNSLQAGRPAEHPLGP